MHWWKLRESGVGWTPRRVLVGFVLCPALLGSIAGCGPSRPDPLAVVKDGGDRDADDRPRPQAAQKPAAPHAEANGPANPPNAAAAIDDQPVAGPTGKAPFDLSFLPVDTELVLVAQCGDIIRSQLVQAVTAGRATALDPLVEGFGTRFADVESLRIGIRNLADLPVPTAADLVGGLGSVSLRDVALHPHISATIVIQSRERVDETPLRTNGEEIRVGDKRYFRLKSTTFQSTCACIQGFRTLIVSDEPTILSIVESKGPPPKPKATFSFAREADLVIALAPEAQSQLQRWLPALRLFEPQDAAAPETGTMADVADTAAGGEQSADTTPAASDVPERERPVEAPGDPAASDVAIVETQTGGADTSPAIPANVTGAALMINLENGVAVSVSLDCDSPQSAEAAEAELRQFAAQLQDATDDHASVLNGGIRDLADALTTTRLQTVVALMTAVTPDRQADVLALPALVLGNAAEAGDSSSGGSAALTAGEPAGAFAQQVLLEGVPPLASAQPLPGMELRGLARWQPMPPGSEGPRQLELGVVALGGAAATAVAAGHFQLQEAEANRLTPLKWVGTSPAYDALGLNPIDGMVPVGRESDASIHPRNGVLTVFTVVPPPEPAAHLQRFRGQFVMRYYTVSDEIVIENLREAIRTGALSQELTQAGVELEWSRLNGDRTLEVMAPESAKMGPVRLLHADGTPVEDVNAHSTRSRGRVLHTLSSSRPLPENVGLSITLNSELAEVEVPFEFANLPIPDVGALSDLQRALLVWTEAEADSGLPEGLLVEAQARWDSPESAGGMLASAPAADTPNKPRRRYVLSDGGDDDLRREAGRGRPGLRSERPLRVLVDLTGPLAEQADALGAAQVTSIETDFRTELHFEGADFLQQDATGGPVPVGSSPRPAGEGPPGGMRIAFRFTPPLEPIHELARFNGSVKLRISQNRTETLISDLHDRVGRKLTNLELSKLGLALVARIDEDQVLVRVLEGADEQISELVAVDMYGDPVPGVVVTRDEASARIGGRRVHHLKFAHGVPTGLGLRIVANSSMQTVDVPFRFTRMPVPAAPDLPGL